MSKANRSVPWYVRDDAWYFPLVAVASWSGVLVWQYVKRLLLAIAGMEDRDD
jgi:hypothetical protein